MKREGIPLLIAIVVVLGVVGATVAFGSGGSLPTSVVQVPGGNPQRGVDAIQRYGCGSCHVIPGVDGADALVGPPLIRWADRKTIAGELPNETTQLIRWIQDPQEVEPGTDMPDLGISEQEARDIAAYLFTLD
jgi:cytochrome c2